MTNFIVEIGMTGIGHKAIGYLARHLRNTLERFAERDSTHGRIDGAEHSIIAGDGDRFPSRQSVEYLIRAPS
ncbi:hypothetical protein [Trinickia sp.]|uniref:hypothetical protein n=1 Tax=Trinickia sp. TaxID=2571163 RepID=UPI003F7E3740